MLGRINTAIGQRRRRSHPNAAAGSVVDGGGGGGGGGGSSGSSGSSSSSGTGGFGGALRTGVSALMSGGGDIVKDLAMFPLRFIEQNDRDQPPVGDEHLARRWRAHVRQRQAPKRRWPRCWPASPAMSWVRPRT